MATVTIALGDLIETHVDIFDFDYPIFSEDYRATFEKHFIDHFYFDEIGEETVARFKRRLESKLNLIMPYWNKIFVADKLEQRILDNYDVTETYSSKIINKSTGVNNANIINNVNSSNKGKNTSNSNTTDNSTTNVDKTNNDEVNTTNENKNMRSDTPVTRTDFDNLDYYSEITKENISGSVKNKATENGKTTFNDTLISTNNGEMSNDTKSDSTLKEDRASSSSDDRTEEWTRKMIGNIGVQTDAAAVVAYWNSLRQIEIEIFEQCSDLFTLVY